jgi:hypothetical protein
MIEAQNALVGVHNADSARQWLSAIALERFPPRSNKCIRKCRTAAASAAPGTTRRATAFAAPGKIHAEQYSLRRAAIDRRDGFWRSPRSARHLLSGVPLTTASLAVGV